MRSTDAQGTSSRLGPITRAGRVAAGLLKRFVRGSVALLPRSRTVVVGSHLGEPVGNPRFWFDQVAPTNPNVIWIAATREIASHLRREGVDARWKWSPQAIRAMAGAAANVVSGDVGDTSFAFTGGARLINLYHGVPLKLIEFDASAPQSSSIYHPSTLTERLRAALVYSHRHVVPDVMCAPTSWQRRTFQAAYRDRVPCIINLPTPRSAWLNDVACRRRAPDGPAHALAASFGGDDRPKILFAPTWRRGATLGLEELFGTERTIEAVLDEAGVQLLYKPHPHAPSASSDVLGVTVLGPEIDVTRLLPFVDGLLTDYSSIMFDMALLDRPVLLIDHDVTGYARNDSAELYLDRAEITTLGPVSAGEEVAELVCSGGWRDSRVTDEIRQLVWGTTSSWPSFEECCERVLSEAAS